MSAENKRSGLDRAPEVAAAAASASARLQMDDASNGERFSASFCIFLISQLNLAIIESSSSK